MNNDDYQIMQSIMRGDQESFRLIYQEHKRRVWGMCLRLMNDAQGAEDMAQETWIKIVRNADQYRPIGTLASWICQVTRNTCLNSLRGQNHEILSDEIEAHAENEFTADDFSELSDQRERLQSAFERLPPQQRLVLVMFIYEELPLTEIAVSLLTSVGAIKQLLFRAKQTLKTLLQEKA